MNLNSQEPLFTLGRRFMAGDPAQVAGTVATPRCWKPTADISEHTDHFKLSLDLPGVDPAGIDVQMEAGVLRVSGERNPVTKDGLLRAERPSGTFSRRFSLPDTVDAARISARCSNGVLELVIPKIERPQPRRITVEN